MLKTNLEEYKRQWYLKNKERLLRKAEEYRIKNADRIRQYRSNITPEKARLYRANSKSNIQKYMKKYRADNKSKLSAQSWKWAKNKITSCPKYKLAVRIRQRLGKAITSCAKKGSAVADLGCSIPELKSYLESKFQPGMSWDNWSRTGWHIDHIIPLSSFDLENREEFLKAVHYTNLQPLWAVDNLRKGAKVA